VPVAAVAEIVAVSNTSAIFMPATLDVPTAVIVCATVVLPVEFKVNAVVVPFTCSTKLPEVSPVLTSAEPAVVPADIELMFYSNA
jgi:hypothetical protein